MIIKEAIYGTELKEIRVLVSNAEYGCDCCKKQINDISNNVLKITVFSTMTDTFNLDFCSWKCLFKHLPKIKTDYFINLPYLSYDNKYDKKSSKEFIKLIKTIKFD